MAIAECYCNGQWVLLRHSLCDSRTLSGAIFLGSRTCCVTSRIIFWFDLHPKWWSSSVRIQYPYISHFMHFLEGTFNTSYILTPIYTTIPLNLNSINPWNSLILETLSNKNIIQSTIIESSSRLNYYLKTKSLKKSTMNSIKPL